MSASWPEIIQMSLKTQNIIIIIIKGGPLTLKVDEDNEVVILEVVAPPQVKVLDEVPPTPRCASVAVTGVVKPAHLGGIVPK